MIRPSLIDVDPGLERPGLTESQNSALRLLNVLSMVENQYIEWARKDYMADSRRAMDEFQARLVLAQCPPEVRTFAYSTRPETMTIKATRESGDKVWYREDAVDWAKETFDRDSGGGPRPSNFPEFPWR